jgi:hypothetical protein
VTVTTGRETDGERDREHDRLEQRPMEQNVGDEDEQHEKEGQAQDQEAELAHADLEGVGRRRWTSSEASAPMRVARPVRHTSALAVPLTTEVPMKTQLVSSSGSAISPARSPACFSAG